MEPRSQGAIAITNASAGTIQELFTDGGSPWHPIASAAISGYVGSYSEGLGILASIYVAGRQSEMTGGSFIEGAGLAYVGVIAGAYGSTIGEKRVEDEGSRMINDSGEPNNAIEGVEVYENSEIDLFVKDGKLKGELTFKCLSFGADCLKAIKQMKKINKNENIDLTINLAPKGTDYDLTLETRRNFKKDVAGYFKDNWIFTDEVNIRFDYLESLTPLHELGHVLGIRHRLNFTNSIMSYSDTKNANFTNAEVQALIEAYK